MDYCDLFISCLDSHSDGTHSLLRIHWRTSDVMLHFSKSVQMKKQTHLYLEWTENENFLDIFFFGRTTPLTCYQSLKKYILLCSDHIS